MILNSYSVFKKNSRFSTFTNLFKFSPHSAPKQYSCTKNSNKPKPSTKLSHRPRFQRHRKPTRELCRTEGKCTWNTRKRRQWPAFCKKAAVRFSRWLRTTCGTASGGCPWNSRTRIAGFLRIFGCGGEKRWKLQIDNFMFKTWKMGFSEKNLKKNFEKNCKNQ